LNHEDTFSPFPILRYFHECQSAAECGLYQTADVRNPKIDQMGRSGGCKKSQ
jgi:hypothetical protein